MQIFVLLVLRNTRTELMGEMAVLLRAPNLDVLAGFCPVEAQWG